MKKHLDFRRLSLAKKSICLIGISVFLLLFFCCLDFAFQGHVYLKKMTPIGLTILLPWFAWEFSDESTHMLDSPHLLPACWIFSGYLLALSFFIYLSFLPVDSKLFVIPLIIMSYLNLVFSWQLGGKRA